MVLGLAATRTRATQLIVAGEVEVDGAVTRKPGTDVTGRTVALIESVDRDEPDYASRGGHKLAGALDDLPELEIRGRRCLDAGASTGGFTDVLLRGGAREVVAVDVGHDQLRPALRRDSRVRVHEGVNVRSLTPSMIGGPVELTVADLSFISLTLVLGALTGCTEPGGDLVVMVKPQFEVGRERLGRGGVVRDAALRARCDPVRCPCGRRTRLGHPAPRAVTIARAGRKSRVFPVAPA